jgi:hypothetical protein
MHDARCAALRAELRALASDQARVSTDPSQESQSYHTYNNEANISSIMQCIEHTLHKFPGRESAFAMCSTMRKKTRKHSLNHSELCSDTLIMLMPSDHREQRRITERMRTEDEARLAFEARVREDYLLGMNRCAYCVCACCLFPLSLRE